MKEFKKGKVQEVVEFICSKNYGDTITANELATMLEYDISIEIQRIKFQRKMNQIKKIVLDYGYILKTILGVGYYILKPKQISGHCYHTYILRSQKLLEKSEQVLRNTDVTELSTQRMAEYTDMRNLNRQLIENMSNTINSSNYKSNEEIYNNISD